MNFNKATYRDRFKEVINGKTELSALIAWLDELKIVPIVINFRNGKYTLSDNFSLQNYLRHFDKNGINSKKNLTRLHELSEWWYFDAGTKK